MITYRIYTIGLDGHFANNEVAECADDKEVVEKALAQANGCAIEIWNNARFVMRLPGDASKRKRHGNLSADRQRFLRTGRS